MIGTLARSRTFSAFRYRNFRLFWMGAVVSLIGMWAQGTAQSYLVWELTRSPLATGLPIFFFGLPTMLFSVVGGVIADRVDRRRLLLVTQGLFMALSALLTLLTWLDLVRVSHIYLLAFASGMVMAVDAPARQALIPRLVGGDDLTNAIALNSLTYNSSRIVGPPIGGLLYAAVGPQAAFLFNTITYLGILIPLAAMDLPTERNGRKGATLWSDLREGLAYVRDHPVVRLLLLLVAMIGIFGFSYLVLMPVMISGVLGGGPAENGYMLGVVGVGATVGALLVATAGSGGRPGMRILGMGTLTGLSLLVFSLSRSMLLSGVAMFLAGGAIIGFLTTANGTLQTLVPDTLRGRVMSLYALALMGSGPANSLFAGGLGNVVGAPGAIAASGALILLPVGYLYLRRRAVLGLQISQDGPRDVDPPGTGVGAVEDGAAAPHP